MNTKTKKSIATTIAIGFVMQIAACGTIMHPERKGQKSGTLDSSIVALDAIGLLFFLIPGIIAFAVDFNNGTIYLPGGSASINSDNINAVSIKGELTDENIEKIVLKETGKDISLSKSEISSSKSNITISTLTNKVKFL